jgi:hypothetical protein
VEKKKVEGGSSIAPSEELIGGYQPVFVDSTLPLIVKLLEGPMTFFSHWWVRWRVPARLIETVLRRLG